MKTKDLQVICEAVEVMIQLLVNLGVTKENPITIGNVVASSKWFAEEIMLDNSYDKICLLYTSVRDLVFLVLVSTKMSRLRRFIFADQI